MFTKVLGVIKGLFSSSGVIVPILAACGVAVPPLAIAVLPVITGLMTTAEEAYGSGTGPLKKSFVEQGAMQIVEGMKQVSTGGQKATWEGVTPEMVGGIVDVVAKVANTISTQTGGEVVIDDSKWIASRFGG